MSWSLFFSTINPICIKYSYSLDEYNRIKDECTSVNATQLYVYYKTLTDSPMSYKSFYTLLRKNFYFDKYECTHGTEFMYYVKLKNIDIPSSIPKDVIRVYRAVNY